VIAYSARAFGPSPTTPSVCVWRAEDHLRAAFAALYADGQLALLKSLGRVLSRAKGATASSWRWRSAFSRGKIVLAEGWRRKPSPFAGSKAKRCWGLCAAAA